MQTGSIIDFYDDPNGMVLQEKVAEAEVPDFIKIAAFLSLEDRQALPDDIYALVMVDQGTKIRKYACVDKGNTALNVMYFMENHDRLPLDAQKTAAANLLTACEWHALQPPDVLEKVAAIESYTNPHGVKFKLKKLPDGGHVGAPKEVLDKVKTDDAGRRVLPWAATGATKSRAKKYQKQQEKTSSAMQPYVDITGKTAPPRFSKRASQRHALEDRFPIDSCGQIKEAAAWFNDYGTSLHPAERRAFCQNVTARADELGMLIKNEDIHKYAGSGYAPDGELKVAVCTRMQYWTEDSPERDLLKGLMNKYASVPPEVFCESLRQFDEQTGMNYHWDDGVCDPWYSTYGIEKKAEWTWEDGNDRLTEDVLKRGAHEHITSLKNKMGDEVALSLLNNPVPIFDSLPLDHKRIISRIVNDAQ